jgi:hypothetical protein
MLRTKTSDTVTLARSRSRSRSRSLSRCSVLIFTLSAVSTGCFYDSTWGARKSAQAHNAARATPASLTSSQASPSGDDPAASAPDATSAADATRDERTAAKATTVLHVRIHAAPAYAAQTPDWKAHVASLLAQASTTLDASVGARLVIDAADPWEHVGAARLDGDLAALREEDTGEGADLVIGFVGGLPLTTQDFEQLGLSELPGKHLVLRAPNVAAEYAAIEKAFDELSAEARTRLRRERIRHREVAVLLHEVGHALGASHLTVSGSLMRPAYDPQMSAFDSDSVTRMKGRLARPGDPGKASTPAPAPASEVTKVEAPTKDDAPNELGVADRALWRRASELAKAGDSKGAWSAARPLFPAYPLVYGVQDLRCKLAMATLRSYDDVRKECDPLMTLATKRPTAK